MRHYHVFFFSWLALMVPANANGTYYGKQTKTLGRKIESKRSKPSNYSGMKMELGANLELQKLYTDSSNFKDNPTSIKAIRYGGNFSLGYLRRFCRNFYAGVFMGVDVSGGRNKMWKGGRLNPTSEIAYQNLIKKNLLNDLLRTISSRMRADPPSIRDPLMSIEDFEQTINFFHYLGETSNDVPSLPASVDWEFVISDRINKFGTSISDSSSPSLTALNSLREFVYEQFPVVCKTLGSVASNGVFSTAGADCVINDSEISMSQYGSEIVSALLRGDPTEEGGYYHYLHLDKASQILPLGLLPDDPNCTDPNLSSDQKQLSTALRAINDMYYNDDALLAPPGVDADALKNKFHTTTSFDVCPHISLQLGYYFKELNGMMYTKVGAMELNGRATIVCDTDNVYTEKFKKWAPFVAVGFNKNLTENFGFAFELAQTFKAKEKLPTIRLFNRYKIDESVTLSRTIFRATLTYRLPHSRN